MRKLDFSTQINSDNDLKKFALVFKQLKEDYNIENMETTLLVFDILERIKYGNLTPYILSWEEDNYHE